MTVSNSYSLLLGIISLLTLLTIACAVALVFCHRRKGTLQSQLKNKQLEVESAEKMLRLTLESHESERKRISKEIHDGIGAMLQALRNTVHAVTKGASDTDKQEVMHLLDELTETVRSISWDLMPTTLDRFGLIHALRELCERMSIRSEHSIAFQETGQAIALDTQQQVLLYRIAQEAIANAIRHARAVQIEVHVRWHQGSLQLLVKDDGIGFEYQSGHRFRSTPGLGLSNMESRAKLLNAELSVEKNLPSGTVLTLNLPIYVG